ncbi:unnamed protein product [Pleuronectes platessa]|uniref:Uncharacterized protein n=1 Tax=Pleuronectes platessa TaxID=8262 RepID=A0A9N7Z5T9_PLEPL|nr:unnamed protein product [Pleuronectes platessa]
MVIKLPEAITIKQQWPESAARSELQRQEAVYTEPSEEIGDTHTRSSQGCFQWDGRKRVGAEQCLGQRGNQTVYLHGAHAKGLGQGHRSVGSLIRLCPGACRHSPQFVKR